MTGLREIRSRRFLRNKAEIKALYLDTGGGVLIGSLIDRSIVGVGGLKV